MQLVLVLGFLVAMRQLSTAAKPHTFPYYSEANVSIAALHPSPAATRSDAVGTRTSQEATAATTTELTASLNPSYSGQSVSFTASVAPQGTGTPTGTLVFLAGATQLAQVALDTNGQAIFATSTLTSGSYSIAAQYGGDSNLGPSTGFLAQVVNTPPTPDSISVNPQMQTLYWRKLLRRAGASASPSNRVARANLNLTFIACSILSNRLLVTLPPSPRRAYSRRES